MPSLFATKFCFTPRLSRNDFSLAPIALSSLRGFDMRTLSQNGEHLSTRKNRKRRKIILANPPTLWESRGSQVAAWPFRLKAKVVNIAPDKLFNNFGVILVSPFGNWWTLRIAKNKQRQPRYFNHGVNEWFVCMKKNKVWCRHIKYSPVFHLTGHMRSRWNRHLKTCYHPTTCELIPNNWKLCPICGAKRPKSKWYENIWAKLDTNERKYARKRTASLCNLSRWLRISSYLLGSANERRCICQW